MAEQTPTAGRYRLIVQRWNREVNGKRIKYKLGDEMDLSDEEARRLAGSKNFPSAVKVSDPGSGSKSGSGSSTSTSKDSTGKGNE